MKTWRKAWSTRETFSKRGWMKETSKFRRVKLKSDVLDETLLQSYTFKNSLIDLFCLSILFSQYKCEDTKKSIFFQSWTYVTFARSPFNEHNKGSDLLGIVTKICIGKIKSTKEKGLFCPLCCSQVIAMDLRCVTQVISATSKNMHDINP